MPSSIIPNQDNALYFVRCDYGRAYNEADPEQSDCNTVVQWLLHSQCTEPERVIEVDLSAGTSKDVTKYIFDEVKRLAFANDIVLTALVKLNGAQHSAPDRTMLASSSWRRKQASAW